jgi:hypothetical protein
MKSAATVIRFPEPSGSGERLKVRKVPSPLPIIGSLGCNGQTEKATYQTFAAMKGDEASYPQFLSRREVLITPGASAVLLSYRRSRLR